MKAWVAGHRWWVLGAGALLAAGVVVVAVVVAVTGPSQARKLPPTRARAYTEQQACLLTGGKGIADPAAAPVWAGMQDASARTRAKVTYLAMAGDQSVGAAGPYLTTLAGRKCGAVLTVGAAPDGAVAAIGPKYPGTRFLVVGASAGGRPAANVTVVPDTRAAVEAAVEAALGK
ncbi:MAG: BMP family ABC transporter substrate-binding protein [Streptomyces sp.]|nr:BMP family ABC transporter substrate-binding protein [Streptomyces sp.]